MTILLNPFAALDLVLDNKFIFVVLCFSKSGRFRTVPIKSIRFQDGHQAERRFNFSSAQWFGRMNKESVHGMIIQVDHLAGVLLRIAFGIEVLVENSGIGLAYLKNKLRLSSLKSTLSLAHTVIIQGNFYTISRFLSQRLWLRRTFLSVELVLQLFFHNDMTVL